MATVADVLVSELRRVGVRALFGVPGGGGNLDLIDAAGRAGLPFVLTATETAAALAAVAQTEITGHPGACLTTLGPGAASVVNGVACAFLDRAPVVVFTDSHPGTGAFEHQRLDHAALLGSVTKSSERLAPQSARQAIRRALHTAQDGRPGPVHLDCPGDVAAAFTPAAGGTLVDSLRPGLSAGDRARIEALLGRARKPLLLVGLGARRAEDAAAIRDLCARRHVPAMVTYKAKGVVPDDHSWFAGVVTNGRIEQPVIDESDLLIGIGLDPVELIPRAWTREQPIVYYGPWAVEDAHVPFTAQVVTAVSDAVRMIESALTASSWSDARARELADGQRRGIDGDAGARLTAHSVVRIAAARLSHAVGCVTVDAGAHMFPATLLWPVDAPNGMLISNGLSTMGFALPAAIGAALVDRDRPVVALTGDGGLLMCAAELLTAARERLRIITIVFSDGSLSLIEIKQQARRLPAAGVALGAIDWPALAESLGVTAFAAATGAQLEEAVEEALACHGPSLIAATIDRSNYGATMRAIRG